MRLHLENDSVKQLLFQGNFGLEKEALRITEDGHMAHTPHPFPGDERITRDFCENQTEINTFGCFVLFFWRRTWLLLILHRFSLRFVLESDGTDEI